MKLFISILFAFFLAADISGQVDTIKAGNDTVSGKFYLLQNVKRDGVSMPEVDIKAVTIIAPPSPSNRSEYRRYERLVYNIKRVYPYAYMVRIKLGKVNEDLKNIKSERDRKEYIKNVEKDVFADYEGDMRQLTITQGRLLIKLIDRETQNTSYDLIKQYRGWFSAAFWQGIARIFGTNLKDEYDPWGEDILIELIIGEIEAGRL